VLLARDVATEAESPAARAPDAPCDRFRCFGLQIGDDDSGPCLGKAEGGGPTDPRSGTRHKRHASGQAEQAFDRHRRFSLGKAMSMVEHR